jgi:uncharacterized membrane protein
MEVVVADWISLALRWAHVMAGIAWIGSSFYFVWLDASLRRTEPAKPGVAGESWMVHGGGFYQVEKYSVAPEHLPKELHWFKYEAYFTWLTGFLLLAIIYYWGAEAYLIDRSMLALSPLVAIAISIGSLIVGWLVYDLLCRSPLGQRSVPLAAAVFLLVVLAALGYGLVFSGRAAFLHAGVFIGTIMVANVFFIIIPNQKKTVAALLAGNSPDPALGVQAKQRSLHNNYLTLPVILMMVSNHYPLLYGGGRGWIMTAGIVLIGGLIRHFFNLRNSGQRDRSLPFLLPAALAVGVFLMAFSAQRPGAHEAGAVTFAEVETLIRSHCVSCHAARPSDENFDAAPADLVLQSPEQIRANAQRIYAQAVLSDTMPLGNMTEMTAEERQILGAWIDQGAQID